MANSILGFRVYDVVPSVQMEMSTIPDKEIVALTDDIIHARA